MSSSSNFSLWLAYLTLAFDLIMVLTHHLNLYFAIGLAVAVVVVVYYLKEIKHMS
jgi:Flp pilus assembly protein TadB